MARTNSSFTSFDGTSLGYSVDGNTKGLALLCCNGIACSKETYWRYIVTYFENRLKIVRFDYRGHFSSDSPVDPSALSIDCHVADIIALLDKLEIEKTVLIGHSMGVQVILDFALHHPERTLGVIAGFGTFENPFVSFLGNGFFERHFDRVHEFFDKTSPFSEKFIQFILKAGVKGGFGFPLARALNWVNRELADKEAIVDYIDKLSVLDWRMFIDMAEHMRRHSLRGKLGSIKAPVLIIAGDNDLFTPLEQSMYLHRHIAGSELLVLKGGSHAAYVEQPQLINLRIEKFFRERIRTCGYGPANNQVAVEKSSDPMF